VAGAAEADARAKKAVRDIEASRARLMAMAERVDDPTDLVGRYNELSKDLIEAKQVAQKAEMVLLRARGQVDEVERLRATQEIAEAINSDDPEIRLKARQRVHEAARRVVQMIVCDPTDTARGQPEPTMTLIMVGGLYSVRISNRGEVLGEADMTGRVEGDERLRSGILSGAGRSGREIDQVVERAKRAESIGPAEPHGWLIDIPSQ
jgi:hypothetical protein